MSITAKDTLLNLPELLEVVLLHLPQKDLLLCQRTARCFRRTVIGSTRLQRALFLAPDWNPSNSKVYSDGNVEIRKPDNNRLLLRAFQGCYPTVTPVVVNDDQTEHSNSHSRAHLENGAKVGLENWSWDVCISFPADQPPDTPASVLYHGASWRRMYLSQPPCTSLHLMRKWVRSVKPAIVRPDGVTMGSFVDKVMEQHGTRNQAVGEIKAKSRGWHESYISSDRDWHFEGNIRYSDFAAPRTAAAE